MTDCVSSGKQVDVSAFYNTTVTSPNYPSEYDDYSDCAWRLSAESGYVVKVVFNDFKLQIGEPRLVNNPCPYDALTFRDGFSASSSLLGVYCFTVHPEVIFSTGRYLYIKFSSNYRFVNKGFSISVSAVKKGTYTTVILVKLVKALFKEGTHDSNKTDDLYAHLISTKRKDLRRNIYFLCSNKQN